MSGQDDRAFAIATAIRKAELHAIKEADSSGWWPSTAMIVGLGAAHAALGWQAAFWLSLGFLIAITAFLWEHGRNSVIELQATEEWLSAFLLRCDEMKDGNP